MSEKTKHCGRCKSDKPATPEFFYSSTRLSGLQDWCKDCMKAYQRERAKSRAGVAIVLDKPA